MLDADRMPDGLQLEERRDLPRALLVRGAVDDPLHVLCGQLLELLGLTVRTREVDRVDVHVPGKPGRELFPVAREEVYDAAGDIGRGKHLGELDGRQRMGP